MQLHAQLCCNRAAIHLAKCALLSQHKEAPGNATFSLKIFCFPVYVCELFPLPSVHRTKAFPPKVTWTTAKFTSSKNHE